MTPLSLTSDILAWVLVGATILVGLGALTALALGFRARPADDPDDSPGPAERRRTGPRRTGQQ